MSITTTIRQQVPMEELRRGDRIEWAQSDQGQGKFWREVKFLVADERTPLRRAMKSVVVENDAGVRTCAHHRHGAQFVRVVRIEQGERLSSNDVAALCDALHAPTVPGAAVSSKHIAHEMLTGLMVQLARAEEWAQDIDDRAAAAS